MIAISDSDDDGESEDQRVILEQLAALERTHGPSPGGGALGDRPLLGFRFEGEYYVDRALPMGCSISCMAFECFSSFLEWAMRDISRESLLVHYLADFLFAGPLGLGKCAKLLADFQEMAWQLGIPQAEEKTEERAQGLTLWGIETDTVAATSRLPAEKLVALHNRIHACLPRRGGGRMLLREFAKASGSSQLCLSSTGPRSGLFEEAV